jgi:hypothetical protein
MKKTLLMTLGIAMFVITGCVSVHNNKAAVSDMPVAVTHKPHYQTITEIGNERVSAEVTGKSVLKFITWGIPSTFADNGAFSGASDGASFIPAAIVSMLPFGDPYADYKKAAVYIACEQNGCDTLVDAQYVISKTTYINFLPFYEEVTCKVTGYPVKITGHKLIEFDPLAPKCGK